MSALSFNTWNSLDGTGNYAAKIWARTADAGTASILASQGLTSITDNGTGLYTLNFTNTQPDVNYSLVGTAEGIVSYIFTTGTRTTTSVQIGVRNGANTAVDSGVNVALFR